MSRLWRFGDSPPDRNGAAGPGRGRGVRGADSEGEKRPNPPTCKRLRKL